MENTLICRLCGNGVNNCVDRTPTHKSCFERDIKNALKIDITEDTDNHPCFLCNSCRCKLLRWRKLKTSNKKDIKINITLKSAANKNEQLNMKLLADLGKENGFFLNEETQSYSELVKIYYEEYILRIKIHLSGKWEAYVRNKPVNIDSSFQTLPEKITNYSMVDFFQMLKLYKICKGSNQFTDVCRDTNEYGLAVFFSSDGLVKAREEESVYGRTVRTESCEILTCTEDCCAVCKLYRSDLVQKRSRIVKSHKSFTNWKYFTSQQLKDKYDQQRVEIKILKRKIGHLEERVEDSCIENGIHLDTDLGQSFLDIIQNNDKSALEYFEAGSPQHVLWKQQKLAAESKHMRQMRWHPTLIRWCIALHSKSPAAYKMIKDSKFLVLPHECTLRDYTQFTTPGCGSNPEVLLRIVQEHLNEVPDFKRNVSLLFDEVKIKSGLVYCSETGNLIGFCDIGSVGNDLATFGRQCNEKEEKNELATHMLTFMVRGIFSSLESVFAYYPCTGFNSHQLYWVVWAAIGNLEIVGFRVRAIVCDGATPNRKFYRLHSTAVNQGVCNYTTNLYFPERRIYFFCDVPHLLKTTRNNLENSNWHNKTRNLHYNGQSLQWTQIVRLVENDLQGLGLRLLPRITVEHLYLTPTLRMRVKLAVQVLSSSTAHALELIGRQDTQSLCLFIQKVDTFVDCLNVRNTTEGLHTKKPALLPYRDVQDWRFEWLEKDFIGWLDQWEASCQQQPDLTQKEKNKLCLSRETLEGFRITDSKSNGDGGISKEEYEELKRFYDGDPSTKTLPEKSTMLCLGETNQKETESHLSLSDWFPWQNRQQPTFVVDHSNLTKNFVEMVQFLELQEALDPNEDNYGQEMEVFLNEADILKPGQNDEDGGNIRQFFVGNDTTIKHGKKKKSLYSQNKPRRSDQLPEFEAFVVSGESDDDDLPAIFDKKDDKDDEHVAKIKAVEITKAYRKSICIDANLNRSEKKHKQKKRNFSGNISVVEVIADTDVNDFVETDFVETVPELPVIDEESQGSKSNEDSNEFRDEDSTHVQIDIEQGSMSKMEASDFEKISEMKAKSQDEYCEDFTKLLPIFFTMPVDIVSPQKITETNQEVFIVPDAPSMDELEVLVENINNLTTLPKLDMAQLVEEWTLEYSGLNTKHTSKIEKKNSKNVEHNKSSLKCSDVCGDKTSEQDMGEKGNLGKDIDAFGESFNLSTNGSFHQKQTVNFNMDISSDFDSPIKPLTNKPNKSKRTSPTVQHNTSTSDNLEHRIRDSSAQSDLANNNKEMTDLAEEPTHKLNENDVEMEIDSFSGSDDFLDTQSNFMLASDDFFKEINSDESNEGIKNKDSSLKPSQCVELFRESVSCIEKQRTGEAECSKSSSSNNKKLSSCKSMDISLFDDSFKNDSVLEAIKTQAVVEENASQSTGRIMSPSQYTFSQALAFVHDSDSTDKSSGEREQSGTFKVPIEKEKDNMNVNFLFKQKKNEKFINDESICSSTFDHQKNKAAVDCPGAFTAIKPHDKLDTSQLNLINEIVNMDNVDAFSDDGEESDVPLFDLGFDVDDDIIPPSPCLSETTSQKSVLKNLGQSFLSSRKSLSFMCDKSRLIGFKNSTVLKPALSPAGEEVELEQEDGDDLETSNTKVDEVSKGNKRKSSTFSRKEDTFNVNPVNFDAGDNELTQQNEDENNINLSDLHGDFEMSPSPVLSGKRPLSQKPVFSSVNLEIKSPDGLKSDFSAMDLPEQESSLKLKSPSINLSIQYSPSKTPPSPVLSSKRPLSQKPVFSPVNLGKKSPDGLKSDFSAMDLPDQGSPLINLSFQDSPSMDDSFVVRKKRKKTLIIDSPITPDLRKKDDFDDFKTPLRPVTARVKKNISSTSSEEESILKKKKPKKAVSFCVDDLLDDESDFEDIMSIKKDKRNKSTDIETKTSDSNKRDSSENKKRKSKSPSNPFLVDEADVSEDEEASTDEEEGSDLDQMEESFVSEGCTQLSQGQHEELQAIYLKSVRSPTGQGGKFKLKYDYDDNIDVYSQVPQDEESQYYDDSFVCDEEEEHDLLEGHEITILDKGNIIDNESFAGPRTRWSKPARHKVMPTVKPIKRKRVKRIADSSSEDESENQNMNFMSPAEQGRKFLDSPAMTQGHGTVSSRSSNRNSRQLLSSSDDEQKEEVISPEIMCSLKSRKKTNKQNLANVTSNQLSNSHILDASADMTISKEKEERIRRQKEKQEEFRKHLIAKQQNNESVDKTNSYCDDTALLTRRDLTITEENSLLTEDSDLLLNTTKPSNNKSVIIVDSREINGAQDIVSTLRFNHNINVVAAQLDSCDYVVSVRMGVDRKQWSEFSNGTNRAKMTERLLEMCDFYERPCLIIEKDKCKPEEKGRILHWTKYVDKTLVHLIQSKMTLFFTENQLETASIVADLCQLENRKNCAISCPINLNTDQQNRVKFYRSIPHLSYVHCLFLCNNYKTVASFLCSDIRTIMTNGKMTEERASNVYNYIRRTFDTQMLPSSYG